jgi:hypothetical protein
LSEFRENNKRIIKGGTKMRKFILITIGGAFLLSLLSAKAEALTFDLNCTLSGAGCASSASFGSITLTDNGDDVDITVDLVGSGVHKIQRVYLNFDDSLFSNANNFDTVSNVGVIEDQNNLQADGYSTGKFDLRLPDPPPGNLGFEPYSDTITLSGFNLNPDHFNFSDTSNLLLGAVHIGNIACANDTCIGQGGEESIWVGATLSQVPEPTTLLLLGSGLIGFALWGRKKLQGVEV